VRERMCVKRKEKEDKLEREKEREIILV